jgi:hypothetical protein
MEFCFVFLWGVCVCVCVHMLGMAGAMLLNKTPAPEGNFQNGWSHLTVTCL